MKQLHQINIKCRHSQRGFSMVELAVVLSIVAVIIGGALTLSNKYMETQKVNKTIGHLQRINSALQIFALKHGYLPCPAHFSTTDPTLFGKPSDCRPSALAPPQGTENQGSAASAVRIGVVPTRFLGLPDRVMFDSWGNRIIYAMIRNIGNENPPYDDNRHANKIEDYVTSASSNPSDAFPATSPITVGYEAGGANPVIDPASNDVIAYVLVSLGKNRYGAFDRNGNQTIGCLGGSFATADRANCNYTNNIFTVMKPSNSSVNAQYADDIVIWQSIAQIRKRNFE